MLDLINNNILIFKVIYIVGMLLCFAILVLFNDKFDNVGIFFTPFIFIWPVSLPVIILLGSACYYTDKNL